MREPEAVQPVRLEDYQPPEVLVDQVHLTVQLFDDHALVLARLELRAKQPLSKPLQWPAVAMQLQELRIDGKAADPALWRHQADCLELAPELLSGSGPWSMETVVRLTLLRTAAWKGFMSAVGSSPRNAKPRAFGASRHSPIAPMC